MKRMVENFKFVMSNVPVDIANAAVTGDYVSMKNYDHLTIVLQFGAVGTGTALTLKQSTNVGNTLSDEKALGYSKIWINVGNTTDTLTETVVTSDTYTVADTPSNLYVIEVDGASLDVNNGFDCVRMNLAAGAGTTLLSVLYILSNSRYSGAPLTNLPSAILD